MTGTFELLVNSHGDYEFQLLSSAGKVLAVSAPYRDKKFAVADIALVRESAAMALITDHTMRPPQSAAPPGSRRAQEAPSRWFG